MVGIGVVTKWRGEIEEDFSSAGAQDGELAPRIKRRSRHFSNLPAQLASGVLQATDTVLH